MYYQNYEDYMRQVLGYPINDPSVYERNDYKNYQTYENIDFSRNQNIQSPVTTKMTEEEIKDCYPDIYNLVYPMVCKACETNKQPITRQLIEIMTDEIYNAIEDTSTNINARPETTKPKERSNNISSRNMPNINNIQNNRISNVDKRTLTPVKPELVEKNMKITNVNLNENKKSSNLENREVLNKTNSTLKDLITILLLQKLFTNNLPVKPRPPIHYPFF